MGNDDVMGGKEMIRWRIEVTKGVKGSGVELVGRGEIGKERISKGEWWEKEVKIRREMELWEC